MTPSEPFHVKAAFILGSADPAIQAVLRDAILAAARDDQLGELDPILARRLAEHPEMP